MEVSDSEVCAVQGDVEKYRSMRIVFSHAESEVQMEEWSLVYVFDETYPRADICMAMKMTSREKLWGPYAK